MSPNPAGTHEAIEHETPSLIHDDDPFERRGDAPVRKRRAPFREALFTLISIKTVSLSGILNSRCDMHGSQPIQTSRVSIDWDRRRASCCSEQVKYSFAA